jgi:small conductance mechanosensitive channel
VLIPLLAAAPLPQQPSDWDVWRLDHLLPWLAMRGVHMAVFLGGAYLLNRLWRSALKRIPSRIQQENGRERGEVERRAETITSILKGVGSIAIYTVASLMILRDFGVEIGPLLAGLGIVGVAVGFGSQYLVKDVVTGFFALMEDQFRVGDVVKINDFQGVVERMFLRTTHVRSIGGELHIIPNGEIRVVTNFTRHWARSVLDLAVSYGADLEEVFEALREVDRRARADASIAPALLEPAEILGVTQLGDSAVTVRLIVKVQSARRWEVERFLRKTAKEVCDERGIEIPFPQRTVSLAPQTVELLLKGVKGE